MKQELNNENLEKTPAEIKQELYNLIKNYPLLKEEEVQLIVNQSDIRFFNKGTVLLQEGEIAQNCYMVIKGCVREYYMVDGDEKSTGFFTEGYPVNSFTSAANNEPSKHFLVCTEDTFLTVGSESLEVQMAKLIPTLDQIIRQEVEKETGKAHDELVRFITSSPEERYLHLLETRPDLLNRIPQHQIASYIGVKPESLSRIRKRMLEKLKKS